MVLNYQSLDYIRQRLEVSHDPRQSIIRGKFFQSEYQFFRKHIRNQNVLVAGSGLGHDSIELAKYNKSVVGVELIKVFFEESQKRIKNLRLKNIEFQHSDFTKLPYPNKYFDSAVLNMGTIGNFDDKHMVLAELLRVAANVYFDFYPPNKKGLEERKKMYKEEGWLNVRIKGVGLVSDDGLDSISLSPRDIEKVVRSLGAKVEFYKLNSFSVMAEITS